MPGEETTRALVEAYPSQPAAVKAALIPVLGARKHPAVLPFLKQALQSNEPPIRLAALVALGDAGLPEGLEPLVAAVKQSDSPQRQAVRRSLLVLAETLRSKGQKNEAGLGFLNVLATAGPDEAVLKRQAVEGLAECPVAQAFETIKAAAADKELREPAIPALLAVASRLVAANEKDKAVALYEVVKGLNPPGDVLKTLAQRMAAAGVKVDLQGLLGTVTKWWVVGPFDLGEKNQGWDVDYVGEPNVNIVGRYMSGKSRVQWNPVTSTDPAGKIDLRKTIANRDQCLGYAYTEITLEKPVDAVLLLGVDDSEKIWVNGQKVFELFTPRAIQIDQDRVPVKLQAGTNKILLKLYQQSQGWEFCLRVVTPDGRPVAFTQKTD